MLSSNKHQEQSQINFKLKVKRHFFFSGIQQLSMSIPSHWQGFSKITHTDKETECFHGAQKANKWHLPLIKNTRQSFCALKTPMKDSKIHEELTLAPYYPPHPWGQSLIPLPHPLPQLSFPAFICRICRNEVKNFKRGAKETSGSDHLNQFCAKMLSQSYEC